MKRFGGNGKGAGLSFLPLSASHRALNFPQKHTGNVIGGFPQDGDGVRGVEVHDMGEVLRLEEFLCVISAAGEHHVGYAV